ncbi:hypothetical protein WICPIJ_000370, partial [Wickerhamomyces pijperi]
TEANPEASANYVKPGSPSSDGDSESLGSSSKASRSVIDDDEDDEDEDEEEEQETVRSRKKARPARNQFIDVEAEVDDEEEDEDDEDDELAREGFIAQEGAEDDDFRGEGNRNDDRLHRQMDRTHERNAEEDAQKLAAQFKERYGKSKSYRGAGSDSGMIPQRFLLPSINDPSIWAVRCRPGKEKEIVKKLLKKKVTLDGKPNALKILSAFQRDNFTGYIYIEAEKLTAVDVALKGLPDIYPNGKVLVPVEEFPDLLRAARSDDVKLTEGAYVRIKRGKYKGDAAIIDSIEESGLEVTLQIIPRLDYKGTDLDDNGKRKRATSTFRPPQRLFNKKEAQQYDIANLFHKVDNTYTYRGENYIDGFLYKLYKVQFLETQNVKPTLEEVAKFDVGDDHGDLDLTSIAQSLKSSNNIVFNTGDRVQVLSGEQQGLQGDVISVANDSVLVKPLQYKGNDLEFPISNLRKIFAAGDHVSIVSGKLTGNTGLVVDVKDDQVTLISDQSHKDVTVFANHLTKSLESSTLIDGVYDLRDLVRLNPTTVAVVIRADKDIFQVLDQEGIVSSLRPSAIESKIVIRRDDAFANDSQGEPIKIGDTVKENSGFKRQGVILHIFRSILFIHSKEIPENAGVFVTDITSVTSVASKNNFTEEKKAVTGIDLTRMNPQYQDGGSMAPPPPPAAKAQSLGRDNTINQHVKIRSGPYKGYRGIIKETNGDFARVELHTKNKLLNIAKTALGFVGRDGNALSYNEYIAAAAERSNGPSYSTYGGRTGHSNSGRTTSYGAGGKTPAWSNAGRGTAYGGNNAGGATAWGASGAGTAYGGNAGTAWGGNVGTAYGTAGNVGTAWGAGGNAGTAWGGNAGTAWGQPASGGTGQASSWGQQTGQTSSWGQPATGGQTSSWGASDSSANAAGRSAWGNNGYQSNHGNGTGYNANSQHGGSQWNQQQTKGWD